jgi:plastocyanin domain-containing protein
MNVLEFTPDQAGTLAYTCAMGMFPATIEVIDPPGGAGAASSASTTAD